MLEGSLSQGAQQRYRILEPLGRGAMGAVYRAEDCERGTEVALKVLKNLDPVAVFRFKQEFRALADVLHPNLVPLYELFAVDGAWYFTMELVQGVDFLRYVRDGVATAARPEDPARALPTNPPGSDTATAVTRPTPPPGALDRFVGRGLGPVRRAEPLTSPEQFERLRQALRQLAQGVAALHAARRLHRDIKPSNVMVTPEGRVVLLDFGIVAYLGDDHTAEATAQLMGTPVYMAPEQADGGQLDQASDWYAVGVMLYEALTGARPFEGELRDVLLRKRTMDPVAPSQLGVTVPLDLERLCMELLAREPARRPPGEQILRRVGAPPANAAVAAAGVVEHALVGRDAELGILRRGLERIRRDRAATIYVRGRSGVGKTALVEEFLREARTAGDPIILTGRCYERESVPYKALDNLMDAITQYLLRLPDGDCLELLPPTMGDLVRLFPVLRRVESVLADAVNLGGTPNPRDVRRRAVMALRELLTRLATRGPVIVWLDDLQWGDSDSASVLNGLLRQPDAPPILTIAGFREDVEGSELLTELLAVERDAETIALRSLSADASVELATHLLRAASAASDQHAHEIAREADGNPLFLLELARHVAEAAGADESIRIGNASLEDMLLERFDRLDPGARRLLQVIAVAGKPIPQGIGRRATSTEVDVRKALVALRAANLVRTQGARDTDLIECYHDRIRELVVSSLETETLRRAHRRLAMVLQQERGDAEQIAYHLESAGNQAAAAALYETAAAGACDALAFDRAASLLRRAIELRPPARQEAARKWALLAGYLSSGGRGKEAAAAYLAAAETALVARALDLRRLAAEQLLHCGELGEGAALLEQVLREIGLRSPATPRRQLASVLYHRARLRLRGLKFRPHDESQISDEQLQRLEVCWSATAGYGMIETLRGVVFHTQHLVYALESGEPTRVARGLAMEAAVSCMTGARAMRRAERISDRSLAMARELEDGVALGWTSGCRAILDYQAGRWQLARVGFEQAQRLLREKATGLAWERTVMDLQHLWALFQLGDLRELARRLPPLLRDSEDRGDLHSFTNLATGVPNATYLLLDQPERARRLAVDAGRRWPRTGFHLQHYWIALARIQISLYEGASAEALEQAVQCWQKMRAALLFRIRMLRLEMGAVRARCHLAVAAGLHGSERSRQLRQAEKLARGVRRTGLPAAAGLADAILAGVVAGRGRIERATDLLDRAAAALDGCDMPMHADLVRYRSGQLRGEAEDTAVARSLRDRGVVDVGRTADLLFPIPMATRLQLP